MTQPAWEKVGRPKPPPLRDISRITYEIDNYGVIGVMQDVGWTLIGYGRYLVNYQTFEQAINTAQRIARKHND